MCCVMLLCCVVAISGYEAKEVDFPGESEFLVSRLKARGWGEEQFAKYQEKRAGMRSILVSREEPDAWHLEWVACLPEHRGKGYMNKLLLAMIDRGRSRGCKTV